MRSEKDGRTLICYAGSASEASIGSKPMGSELDLHMVRMPGRSELLHEMQELEAPWPWVSWRVSS
jgi:hypothetical protein